MLLFGLKLKGTMYSSWDPHCCGRKNMNIDCMVTYQQSFILGKADSKGLCELTPQVRDLHIDIIYL